MNALRGGRLAAPRSLSWLPAWLAGYRRADLPGDLTAGLIVAAMLVPQSLAYAMLAGLPPEMGLYASILPLAAYALFGTSMTLAVGPVAVISLMTASALQPLAAPGSAEYASLAAQLALLSGGMLLAFGLLRFGFIAHLLSHPVIAGFISGSAILIVISQAKFLLGLHVSGASTPDLLLNLLRALPDWNPAITLIGFGTIAFLVAAKIYAAQLLALMVKRRAADLLARLAPLVAIFATTGLAAVLDLETLAGVQVVGAVPQGLPALSFPVPDSQGWMLLWLPALLISLVGFVESVSVARSLAERRRERIQPDRELLGLGAANVASAVSGGFPVTGGFARSVVNLAAGANTPFAGIVSAVLMGIVVVGFTGIFHHLPQAVLAATIIVAVVPLIDLATPEEGLELRQGGCGVLSRYRRWRARLRRRAGHPDRGRAVAWDARLAQQSPAHGAGRTRSRDRAFPQRRTPPSGDASRPGGTAHRREPVLRQR